MRNPQNKRKHTDHQQADSIISFTSSIFKLKWLHFFYYASSSFRLRDSSVPLKTQMLCWQLFCSEAFCETASIV